MPPAIPLILAGIQAAIAIAPEVEQVIAGAKQLIVGLFSKGLITKEQQDTLHAWVDSQAAMAQAGLVPASWQVDPDPAPATPVSAPIPVAPVVLTPVNAPGPAPAHPEPTPPGTSPS
jgi:hypothetical protein